MDVVGVSRPRTGGSFVTKSGRKSYRGARKHWYVYFYDDEGRFRKKKINAIEVPYYGSLIRHAKTFLCSACGTKFRSLRSKCPNCGMRGARTTNKPRVRLGARKLPTEKAGPWTYRGVFGALESDSPASLGQT